MPCSTVSAHGAATTPMSPVPPGAAEPEPAPARGCPGGAGSAGPDAGTRPHLPCGKTLREMQPWEALTSTRGGLQPACWAIPGALRQRLLCQHRGCSLLTTAVALSCDNDTVPGAQGPQGCQCLPLGPCTTAVPGPAPRHPARHRRLCLSDSAGSPWRTQVSAFFNNP